MDRLLCRRDSLNDIQRHIHIKGHMLDRNVGMLAHPLHTRLQLILRQIGDGLAELAPLNHVVIKQP